MSAIKKKIKPAVENRRAKFNYIIELALAGFDKKDIEVTYADNTLTIKSIS